MLSINEKISLKQLQALIILSAIGTGVIILPRRVSEYAGSDGWLIALGLTLLGMIIGALVSTAARLRPADNFIQSTGHFLTRPVAYFLGAILWLKLVASAGLELRAFMLIMREVLLPQTPIPITGITMLFVAGYAAVKGIETRARVAELLLALMVIPFVFLIIVAATATDWSNLQPVFVTQPRTLLQGTLRLGFLFTGLECVLLISPCICPEKKMRKAVVSALGFAGIIVTVVTVLTLAKFGRGVVDLPWPVLSMMDMINLPGRFIERQGALMFSFWIITIFAFINMLLFFGGVLVKNCFGKKEESPPDRPHGPSRANRLWQIGVLVTAVCVYGITFMPWDEAAIYRRLDFMYLTLGVFYLVVLPLVLILVSRFKGGYKNHNKKATAIIAVIMLSTLMLGGLSACWDKVEIENRAFVVAVAIDRAESDDTADKTDAPHRYTVTLSLPAPNDSKEDHGEDAPPHIVQASAQTIAEAIKMIDAETKTQLYFGQAKILVLGKDLLEEPGLVHGVVDIFNRHPDIDRNMYVLATWDKAADILTATPQGDARPGRYIAAIYQDKRKIGGASFPISLDKFVTQMKYENAVLIPAIDTEDDKINFSGAMVVADGRMVGKLSEDELRGYLWCVDEGGLGAIVTAEADGQVIPFKVEKHTASLRFVEVGDKLQAHIKVELAGCVEEYPQGCVMLSRPGFREYTATRIEEAVKEEILDAVYKMRDEYKADGFHWLEIMRKKQHGLYQRYEAGWVEVFTKIEIVPSVDVLVKV